MTKTTILLVLAFIMMSAASVNAQVRIGGLDDPNPSAVLDLNATNATNNGELGLVLPRVELTSTTSFSPLKAHVAGMTVYNTKETGNVTPGTYYNDGEKWVRIGSGTLSVETDGGLTISSTAGESYTFGIAMDGVTTAKIANSAVTLDKLASNSVNSAKIVNSSISTTDLANGAVTAAKLNAMGATSGQVLIYNGSTWAPVTLSGVAFNCSGAIVYGGAYNGPGAGAYTTGSDGYLDGYFSAGWTDAVFTARNKDLCWAAKDYPATWTGATPSCASLTDDNSQWRLPNLKELQVLYEALGGSGNSATDFSVLDTSGKGISNSASAMKSSLYWSSTEYSSDNAYMFAFYNGDRFCGDKEIYFHVRCVRSL
jgi:hypothetical protein